MSKVRILPKAKEHLSYCCTIGAVDKKLRDQWLQKLLFSLRQSLHLCPFSAPVLLGIYLARWKGMDCYAVNDLAKMKIRSTHHADQNF
jgi:hypothetical protein